MRSYILTAMLTAGAFLIGPAYAVNTHICADQHATDVHHCDGYRLTPPKNAKPGYITRGECMKMANDAQDECKRARGE
jgi:hypothetical protein